MARAKDLNVLIREIRCIADNLNMIADTLTANVESETPKTTLEEIRSSMKLLSEKGYAQEMKDILSKHGANNLTSLDPKEYESVMSDMEVFDNAT